MRDLGEGFGGPKTPFILGKKRKNHRRNIFLLHLLPFKIESIDAKKQQCDQKFKPVSNFIRKICFFALIARFIAVASRETFTT